MHRLLLALLLMLAGAAQAADWKVTHVGTPGRVIAIATVNGEVRVDAGWLWYVLAAKDKSVTLRFVDQMTWPKVPEGALPDGHLATGKRDIARAWLAEPTERYDHGVLGDKIEAGSVAIETSAGKRFTVKLKPDAVFEDLNVRLADLDGDGRDEVVVVKSYLKRGAALAVIAERRGNYEVVVETPPLGEPHRWLDPAGIADFTGDGKPTVALVRQPHVTGALELWGLRDGNLQKLADLPDFANHVAGSRDIDMSAVADFDGDGKPDLALPSFNRTRLRIMSFAPNAREIASVPLPAKAATNLALLPAGNGPPLIVLGLENGWLVTVGRE
jgi:hypothetical protein